MENRPFTVHKGIAYFPSRGAAYRFASAQRLPTNRIIKYGRGWAIQFCVSGPYFGTDNPAHTFVPGANWADYMKRGAGRRTTGQVTPLRIR